MKNKKTIILLLILVISISSTVAFSEDRNNLRIVFSHDIHDHIEDYNIYDEGKIKNIGGYHRINEVVANEKNKHGEILLLDAGDYSMGTLFQTIYEDHNPSLRLLGLIGYDATTLGNHEFDFRSKGLSNSLINAKKSGDKLPDIVSTNVDFENLEDVEKENVNRLEKAFKEYGVKDYTVIEKNGFKIAVFGVLGYEAISNAPMAEVNFKDPIEASKKTVNEIKKNEDVDMIVCLSHSGTKEKKSKSEDENLAKKVKGIDLIISGHTHRRLDEPIFVGDTAIVSSGRYGAGIGRLTMKKDGDKWKLIDYNIEDLDFALNKNKEIERKIKVFKNNIQKDYLNKFGLKYDQVLAKVDFNFTESNKIGKEQAEDRLGNLIADSFIYAVEKYDLDKRPVDVSIVPAGTVRDSFVKGEIKTKEVFNANSLGIGEDNLSGYPLISVYLTGKELKTAAEVDASVTPLMPEAQLYTSGLQYEFNKNRFIFNKVTDVYLNKNGKREEIEDDKLYRVVAGLYTGQMLSVVNDKSFGLLSIVPKDKNGKKIEEFSEHIIYDKDKELKEWYAVSKYISSFEKNNGISKIPTKYKALEKRKIVNDEKGFVARFNKPNKMIKILYALVLLLISLVLYIFYRIKNKRRI